MSFSSDVKEELLNQLPNARHCRVAELTAILLMTNSVRTPYICIKSENFNVVKKFTVLVYRLFQIPCQVRVRIHKTNSQRTTFSAMITDSEQCNIILQTCKLTDSESLNRIVVQKDCCKRAYLRGAYLASGSMNNPEKSYHFEIPCDTKQMADDLKYIMYSFGIDGKIVVRKKYYVLYLKEADLIVDALNVIEAHKALMEMENIRILKDVRNYTNRKVNCDMANISKIVSTAQKQLDDIRLIAQTMGLSNLKDNLREIAELRIEEPELSLKELGELLDPPVSKSGVNHRLKKISEIADSIREERL